MLCGVYRCFQHAACLVHMGGFRVCPTLHLDHTGGGILVCPTRCGGATVCPFRYLVHMGTVRVCPTRCCGRIGVTNTWYCPHGGCPSRRHIHTGGVWVCPRPTRYHTLCVQHTSLTTRGASRPTAGCPTRSGGRISVSITPS